ncbi:MULTISPECIES: 5-guanidino-2-oxopentanoate decarboxylase [unclassified Halomonas]|uniref:5-guanidino-2-oxopentanoate decarboxylase n=1 Tax=unclassified Halomonas TaxID=2609666 RepID=UPI002097F560|nr:MULTISPECIES: 5-guanidino-2-oxopentanoate decarboxylase [unclassified Halomonas]MCJ8287457.1 5-guanidino-2-oxopentanoate decarboxylase [Halomonas sp.]MCO7217299.1 5-guanidino-2-oxopentanoate decarboxylase [Halomonas sp. OfavH-34-E]NQY72177.1 5-guanidino-2-oxopentanoate decarboxylase [Halomonas sp.]
MTTCAQRLIELLEAQGIDTVFGIPGVHTVELYRGLEHSRLRHVTPRHEQGAGFMADGYARASGRPAACFIITGPGMTNIATAMGQALADSVPMLVISSVNTVSTLGRGQGRLHEMPHQGQTLAGVARFSHTLLDPEALPEVLARAFAVFQGARPGPVHIEIPIDLFAAPVKAPMPAAMRVFPPAPAPQAVAAASRLLGEAQRPLVLVGGGACAAATSVTALVEHLDAPTLTTINARGLLGADHPLDLGATASLPATRRLARQADVILALGTELGETDYDLVFDDGFKLEGSLIRVDLDAEQLARSHIADLALVADIGLTAEALLVALERGEDEGRPQREVGRERCERVRHELALADDPELARYRPLFATLDEVLPEAIIVGDSTGPVYAGNVVARRPAPRRWFNAATGFGTLGYGLPAALGAGLARPDLPVVALVGDGGLQFVLGELATARDIALEADRARAEQGAIDRDSSDAACADTALARPLAILIWNNDGYDEIRRYMSADGVAHVGVDLAPPDFAALAQAFDCRYRQVASADDLASALSSLNDAGSPLIVEIDALAWCRQLEH